MGQFSEFYNLDLLDVNTPPDSGHVRLFRNKNAARNLSDPNAPFLVKHSDGYLEPLSTPGSTGSTSIEDGTFGISADGSTGDINGNPITPTNNGDGSWTITVPTVKKLQLVHFNASSNTTGDADNFKFCTSYGKADANLDDCIVLLDQKVAGVQVGGTSADVGDSINVSDVAGNGWVGFIQNITNNSYDVVLFKGSPSGLLTFVQWHGIMG